MLSGVYNRYFFGKARYKVFLGVPGKLNSCAVLAYKRVVLGDRRAGYRLQVNTCWGIQQGRTEIEPGQR
jgi:hypothetical protein